MEETAGPDEAGTGWTVTLRLDEPGARDSLVLFPEDRLEPTGFVEDERGDRVSLVSRPDRDEPRDSIELRLFTEIVDGIVAARVAETIERELVSLLGANVSIEAERHWSEPYNYELAVTVHPLDDPVEALRLLAEEGDGGWLSCRDDGWRCDLWWSAGEADAPVLVVPEVRSANVAYLPWRSPRRRAEEERPLVAVDVPDAFEYPEEPGPGEPEA